MGWLGQRTVSSSAVRNATVGLACVALAAAYFGCSPETGRSQGRGAGAGGDAGSGDGSSGSGSGATGGSNGGSISVPDSAGGTGTLDPDAGCASATLQSSLAPANLLFVIDKSGSMNCNLPQDGQTSIECEASSGTKKDLSLPSKWQVTEPALLDAIQALQLAGNVSVGISMFPTDNRCGVKSAPDVPIQAVDTTHYATIANFLGRVSPIGQTPLAGATILGFKYMSEEIVAGRLVGNHFVVLLTDGAESCKLEELPKLLGQDIPNARLFNIRTFVIGAPGSEDARALLSQMAYEGGTAKSTTCVHDASPANVGDCHFDMTQSTQFAQDLAGALAAVSGEALSCEIDVPQSTSGVEVDLGYVNVEVNGAAVLRDKDDCVTQTTGWNYNADQTKIVLCGTACSDAQQAEASIQVVLGCPSKVY